MRRAAWTIAAALCLGQLLAAPPAVAQVLYLAFGDSITAGEGDDPERSELGYPPRLEELLRGAGIEATVENHGLGGERTPEGLTRIDEVLDGGGDALLLMEGSNDISRLISLETTVFNLDEMASKAEAQGMEVVHATLIPRIPWANVDRENVQNQRTCEWIRDLAGSRERQVADNFEVFGAVDDRFASLYVDDRTDRVGHPNAEGYDLMAEVFFDVLTGVDSVPPVTGVTAPFNGETGVPADTVLQIDVWDFGEGIDLANAAVRVNGSTIAAGFEGDSRSARLRYRPPEPFRGVVTVELDARDQAVPANVVDRQIIRFVIEGTDFLAADLDLSGRVDGADLVLFATRFGAQAGDGRYDAAADFNGDGVIDGADLAVLASDFGESAS